MSEKTCPRCGQCKPFDAFHAAKARPDGRQVYCRTCKSEMAAARNATPEAKARAQARHLAIKAADHEALKAQKRAAAARFRQRHLERARESSARAQRKRWATLSAALNEARRLKWAANPELAREKKRQSYIRRREKVLAEQKRLRPRYAAKLAAANRKWREKNADRKRAVSKLHYEANKAKWREYGAARKAAMLKATPPWADREAIRQFYLQAPPGYEIDHVVPLQGRTVCGLHWVGNFQYLTRAENQSKYNRRWPDMPEETAMKKVN